MTERGWRIGALFSHSGVTAAAETAQANATLLACEEINAHGGVRGREIQSIFYDPGCSTEQYRKLAIHLLVEDKIRAVFGCYMSSARKVVLPEIEAHRALLFYPTFYEGFEYSSQCYYTGSSSNQNAVFLARYLLKNYGKNMFLIGSNYVFPYEYNRVIGELVKRSGGRIVDEVYVPVTCKPGDFDHVIRQIRKTKPDVIVSTVVGTGAVMLYDAYYEAKFDSALMPIASLTTTEAEVSQMRPEVAKGHLTSASFFETLDTPAAQRFVCAFKHRFGATAPVTAGAEAAYFQVYLYAQALEAAGDDSPDAIAAQLGGMEFDAPQGRVRIDPDNHHSEIWSRIGKINDQGRFEIVWQSENRIRPDPYFVAASYNEWASGQHLKRAMYGGPT